MRVGILSYPMLFQRAGGLQLQVRETIAALARLPGAGIDAELADPATVRLDGYDVLHVFSAINGNHRIVESAHDLGVPVVLSPLVSPSWNRANGVRARLGDRLLGRLTQWNVQSSYAQIRRALVLANCIVALGAAEKAAIESGFLIEADRVRILPNGVHGRFFESDERLFRSRTRISGPFVLMVGAISSYKNQLGMAQALVNLNLPLVIIGEAQERDTEYMRELLGTPGTVCLGRLRHDDPLLPSAYAAASVFALPSQGEVFPLTVMEALAAGTPVVMSRDSALQLPGSEFAIRQLAWTDTAGQRAAVLDLLARPPARAQVRALVRGFSWDVVAVKLAACYREVVRAKERGERCAV